MAAPNDFEGQADNAEHLRDTLEAGYDEGQALADEKQVSADVYASEVERRDPSDREIAEAAYDVSAARREARYREADAATGNRPEDFADPG